MDYLVDLSRQSKPFFTNVLILIAALLITAVASNDADRANASTSVDTANADSSSSNLIFDCLKVGQTLQCDPMTNKFSSVTATGQSQQILTNNLTKIDPVEGVFGNALAIYGDRQQYLTLPNQPVMNQAVFSFSFWIKQAPTYLANSTVISHVNSGKAAGWNVESLANNSQNYIQFSVTNSESKTFSVSSPIEPGIFQNVVGVFDGKLVKIYVNGFLTDTIAFVGDYDPDPNVPLTIGLDSNYQRPWTGVIDEVRLYNKSISDNTIHNLADYSNYSRLSDSPSNNDSLIGYWPFDEGLQDKSGKSNNGKLILPAASMAFSPDGRLFFSIIDAGEIRIMDQNLTEIEEPFVRLRDPTTNVIQRIHGITLDPDFSTNHYVYAYVSGRNNQTGETLDRVVRFTESRNKATDPKVITDNISAKGKDSLFAGALAFGQDEKLYIATGQDANMTGKVLRINRNGTIPPDNPFPNSPVYTLGHRNMFGIAFDPSNGVALVTENGGSRHDEINVLKDGGNYGYPITQLKSSSAAIKSYKTDNSSAIAPARTYYKPITPTQAIFYDGNRFLDLRGLFLLASYGEGSIHALSINKTGSLVEEIAIRLPEVSGHIMSIAKTSDGEIYIAGENIYKLISLDDKREIPKYFIETVRNTANIQIDDMTVNLSNKVLSINISNSNTSNYFSDNSTNASSTSPSLRVSIPKALLGIIYEVTSENYNKSSDPEDKIVENFETKQTRRITNAGNTIIDIQLNNKVHMDKILIKGQSSTLVKPPNRNVQIER